VKNSFDWEGKKVTIITKKQRRSRKEKEVEKMKTREGVGEKG
jgi:hypothetical protein